VIEYVSFTSCIRPRPGCSSETAQVSPRCTAVVEPLIVLLVQVIVTWPDVES